MRKNTIISILALVLTIAAFITIKPLWLEDGRKHNQPNNLTVRNLPIQTFQHNQFGKMQKVDMLHANHEIIRKLNSNPSIKLIHHNKMDKSHYYDNEVIVNFKVIPNQETLNRFIRDIDGSVKESHETAFIFKSNSKTAAELERYFANNKTVEYAEPHYIILQNEVNDTYYQGYQWNLPAIGTEDGWNLSRGSKDVKIAVIDTGVDLDHPDLTRRLIKGYNALADSYNPDDDNGHGSHVAGIIASETNNGTGMAGITWYNPIIPVKVMGSDGTGGSFYVAKGIRWAVDHGANVINLSLGVYQSCELLEESIRYALEKDVVVVSAAGNDNTNQPSFPAAYPGVLGVAAVDWDGTRATFSNYGNYIDVAAPGVDIPSTFSNGRYAALSGTSMAAPHVAALAGLIRSVNPKLKNSDVVKIIKQSTQPTDEQGPNPYFGNGIIDNVKALQMASRAK
jgi:thermitase